MALDRDEDGFFDRDELDAGSDPADPDSFPGGAGRRAPRRPRSCSSRTSSRQRDEEQDHLPHRRRRRHRPGARQRRRSALRAGAAGTVKATLQIASAASGQTHSTDLPCGTGSCSAAPSNPKGYKYKDTELDDGTAKTVVWKTGKQLKAVLSGKGAPSTLDYDLQLGVPQGTVAAVFQSGSTTVCSTCPPSNGRDGSDGKQFAGRDCPAPVACP